MGIERSEYMNKIINELYDCLFELPNDFFERQDIKKKIQKQELLVKEIIQLLPEEKKKLIYDYEVALHDSMEHEVFEAFKEGLRIGFLLKKELKR